MKRRKYIFLLAMFGIFLLSVLAGCRIEETDEEKIKDLDYTVCDESKLPDALVDLIQEKRKEPFKLTYRTRDYLYIVVGYGAQDRTDLNVLLTELYLTQNAIFVDTELTAVEDTTLADNLVSYPWIAVKCERYDVQIIFR
ncbi:MAG: protease complex subunit PrcB family protein [Clostridium sp.]|nr:protease complex subunit PrcB family protein [Clostridium sp.]